MMKKITTHIKTTLLAAVVLVMAQACIPTVPVGGNPTPTVSTFDIYISDAGFRATDSGFVYKLVTVDDDSIYFTIKYNVSQTMFGYIVSEDFDIFLPSTSGSISQFLYKYDTTFINDSTYNSLFFNYDTMNHNFVFPLRTLPAGLLVNENMDGNTYKWINATSVNLPTPYTNFNQKMNAHLGMVWNVGPLEHLQSGYFVFRRLKGTGFRYYWVKVDVVFSITGLNFFTTTLSNGKSKIGDITTGL